MLGLIPAQGEVLCSEKVSDDANEKRKYREPRLVREKNSLGAMACGSADLQEACVMLPPTSLLQVLLLITLSLQDLLGAIVPSQKLKQSVERIANTAT